MTFGEVVAKLLKEQNMSAKELAGLSGLNQPYISRLIDGHIKDPTFIKAAAICKAFGVSFDYVFELMDEGGNNG